MAIVIKSLQRIADTYTDQGYLYKDLDLDIQFKSIQSPGFKTPVLGNDLKAGYDIKAISNSLQNLFNTMPGQRFLFPEYGLDLYQYLFQPISEQAGQAIGERMLRVISKFEPRVQVRTINVIADPDNSLYNFTIEISIPSLTQNTSLNGVLDTRAQSFIFVPTSRNT